MRLTVFALALILFSLNPVLAQGNSQTLSTNKNGAKSDQQVEAVNHPYRQGQPGPFYKPRNTDSKQFDTNTLTSMPEFNVIPAYPGKPIKFLGGSAYSGQGSVKSASFEVGQPLKSVLSWYSDSLKLRGWKIEEKNLGFSGHLLGILEGQPSTFDIQMTTIKGSVYKTRVHVKEASYQNVPVEMVGGGKPVSPDSMPALPQIRQDR